MVKQFDFILNNPTFTMKSVNKTFDFHGKGS